MVGLFVRLKLRLLRNQLCRQRAALLALLLGSVATFPLLVSAFVLMPLVRSDRQVGDPLVLGIFVLTWLGWTFLPIFAFGNDETVDPARLALLPLRRRELVLGMLAAACVGVPAVATLLGLGGTIWAYGRTPVTFVLSGVAVVLHLLLCVASSRVVTTLLSNVLRTRRGRDAVVVVSSLLGLTFFGLQSLTTGLLASGEVAADSGPLLALLRTIEATPPGVAVRALVAAGDGDLTTAVLRTAFAVGWLVLLLVVWGAALQRALVPPSATATTGRSRVALFSGPLRLLPRTRAGAIAARDLRYAVRDPHRRAQLLSPLLIAVLGPFRQALGADDPAIAVTVMATSLAFLGGMTTLNQLGFEGGPRWSQVAAPGGVRADLVGRNIASTVLSSSLALVGAGAAAALTDGWGSLVPALVLATAVVLVELAVGNLISARFAMPLPDPQTNLWGAAGGGRGCLTALGQVGGLLGQLVVLSPVVVAVVLTWRAHGPASMWLTAPLAVAYAAVVWRVAAAVAVRWITAHDAELLAAVSPRAG